MINFEKLRASFPALERVHRGVPVAYFDGPGGTQIPRVVADAVTDYLFHRNANTHWNYPTSEETDATIWAGREAVADLFNSSPSDIVFGQNMTSLTFHLARALGREWGQGDEVVVTELDHHANVDPWHRLAVERNVTVRVARMIPETGELDWQDLESKVNKSTRLLAIGAASNAPGTINDLQRAVELARAAGSLIFVDAVHYAAHAPIDVRQLDCDLLACSAYKFYGPHVGALYGRSELLSTIDFPKLRPAPDSAPERVETGTQNHEGIAGTTAAIDFLAGLTSSSAEETRRARLLRTLGDLHERGHALFNLLWQGLSAIDRVRPFGPPPGSKRTPTLSFVVENIASGDVARSLAERGIFVSHGNFYALTVAERLGCAESGVVRAGCACYTTEEEVGRLIEAVSSIARLSSPSAECGV